MNGWQEKKRRNAVERLQPGHRHRTAAEAQRDVIVNPEIVCVPDLALRYPEQRRNRDQQQKQHNGAPLLRRQRLTRSGCAARGLSWKISPAGIAVYVDENGAILSRAASLKVLVPLLPNTSGHISITDYRVRFENGSALVIHCDDEHENYRGVALRAGYLATETCLCHDRQWKLAFIHTYAEANDPPAIAMPISALRDYVGRYRAAPDLVTTIRRSGDRLELDRSGRPPQALLGETPDVLFVPGQRRVKRIFVRDAKGRVATFIDRREGEDIVWSGCRSTASELHPAITVCQPTCTLLGYPFGGSMRPHRLNKGGNRCSGFSIVLTNLFSFAAWRLRW